ncbi:MAG TPA: hypothetical protein VLT61_15805, partial [Anaeromyxobacteraceae bacterium]|nr:hypothetical protein [Anaeromyxobacteraceae bacterium]
MPVLGSHTGSAQVPGAMPELSGPSRTGGREPQRARAALRAEAARGGLHEALAERAAARQLPGYTLSRAAGEATGPAERGKQAADAALLEVRVETLGLAAEGIVLRPFVEARGRLVGAAGVLGEYFVGVAAPHSVHVVSPDPDQLRADFDALVAAAAEQLADEALASADRESATTGADPAICGLSPRGDGRPVEGRLEWTPWRSTGVWGFPREPDAVRYAVKLWKVPADRETEPSVIALHDVEGPGVGLGGILDAP